MARFVAALNAGGVKWLNEEKNMTDQIEVDGELRNVIFESVGEHVIAWGNIYDDRKGRFNDGDMVHTSAITKREGDVIWTRNSVYRIKAHVAEAPPSGDLFMREEGQPRNPARIPRMIDLLRMAWAQNPDLRMGQLLTNAAGIGGNATSNIFNTEEEIFAKGLLLMIKDDMEKSDAGG